MPFKRPLIFFPLLLFICPLTAQTVPCEDIELEACGANINDDGCYRVEIPYFFTYQGSGSESAFDADEIKMNFTLEGNAIFDYEMINNNLPGVAPPYAYVNASSSTAFDFYGACDFGPYEIKITDCGDPIILVYVIAEPGETFQILTDVAAYYKSPPFTECEGHGDDCDNGEITSTDPIIVKDVPSASTADLSFGIHGLPSGPVSPHTEVQLYLDVTNNGTTSVTLSEADFRIRVTDVYSNLEAIGISAAAAASGPDDPPIYVQDGDEYYFYLDEFDDATIGPSETVTLLPFSILPPDGLANLYGEAEVELLTAHASIEGGPCGSFEAPSEATIVFPGELPCEGGLEDVEIVVRQYSGPSLDYCQVAFSVVLNSPDPLDAERLFMQYELTLGGTMYISEVNLNGALAGCGGCLSFSGNTITYDFDDAMNPLDISDDGSDGFEIILDGLYGSLDAVEFLQAAIQVAGVAGGCIPDIVYHPSFVLPLVSACDYCGDIYTQVGNYSSPGSLGDCEGGFGIYLRSPTGHDYDRVFVDFQVENPNGLTLDVSSITCPFGNNLCSPAATGWTTIDDCLAYNAGTGTYRYWYCPYGGPLSGTAIQLLDVKASGMGCIPGVTFLETTKVLEDGASGYCYPLEYPDSPFPICNDCDGDEYMISGNIRTEDNEGVYVADDPDEQGVYILSGEGTSCPSINATGILCKEVTNSGNCTGDYDITINCTADDEFSIVPFKDIGYLNGVTTFDLVLISKHILGIQPLGSPYKIIAADANGSKTVTTFDIVTIRKVILFIESNFGTNSTSWRFIDASYTFPNPSNPFQTDFPECIHVDLSVDNAIGMRDFIAVKIGDVNTSADPCLGFTGSAEERGQAVPLLAIGQRKLNAGETVSIEFTIQSPEDLVSWELGLRFDPDLLQLLDAQPGNLEGVNTSNFGTTQASEGKLRALWVAPGAQAVPFREGIQSFRLQFKALRPIDDLAALLSLDPAVLPSRAYRPDGSASPFQLGFEESSANSIPAKPAPATELAVTTIPNPFSNVLKLVVATPEDDWLVVEVFAADGRTVARWYGEALAPQQELVFDHTENWGLGVFTYRARTAQHSATGKITRQ
ncbi:MAG: hypothetical protein H6577_03670 [Lewinellaceae bacterium]|nr:hypothetical protein [Saprospiraceae bacterium]MCB9337201.1 hypothetical protein [Lewinellaceae bacterium]